MHMTKKNKILMIGLILTCLAKYASAQSAVYKPYSEGEFEGIHIVTQDEIIAATASSYDSLRPQRDLEWPPSRLIDHHGGIWASGKLGDTRGEWVKIELSEKQVIKKIAIYSGNGHIERFRWDARPEIMTLELSNGYKKQIRLEDVYTAQYVNIESDKPTTYVKLTINSIYPTTKYLHTCIAEIILYADDKALAGKRHKPTKKDS